MKKYLIDTNIFFLDPKCIDVVSDNGENEIYLCSEILDELDKHKVDTGLNGYNIRKSIKNIDKNMSDIKFVLGYDDLGLDLSVNDNKIIGTAKKHNLTIITNDLGMRVKCGLFGIEAESYREVNQVEIDNLRKGVHYINATDEVLNELYTYNRVKKSEGMVENDFVVFKTKDGKKISCLVKGDYVNIQHLTKQTPKDLKYRNYEQQLVATHIYENDLEAISITGTAGVGKNFISLAVSLDLIDKGRYDKLFICKSPAPLDKDFETGFRPGEWLEGKMLPALASFTSNLNNLKSDSSNKRVNGKNMMLDLIDFGIIEIVDLEHIQGASLPPKSIVIFDEFQTIEAMKNGRALLSRVGEDSLILCLGDLKQRNSSKHTIEESALYHLINSFSGYEKYAHIELTEVVRSGFVKELSKRW